MDETQRSEGKEDFYTCTEPLPSPPSSLSPLSLPSLTLHSIELFHLISPCTLMPFPSFSPLPSPPSPFPLAITFPSLLLLLPPFLLSFSPLIYLLLFSPHSNLPAKSHFSISLSPHHLSSSFFFPLFALPSLPLYFPSSSFHFPSSPSPHISPNLS